MTTDDAIKNTVGHLLDKKNEPSDIIKSLISGINAVLLMCKADDKTAYGIYEAAALSYKQAKGSLHEKEKENEQR